MSSLLEKNLQAISIYNQELVQRICLPAGDSHIHVGEDEEVSFLVHGTPHHIRISDQELNSFEFPEITCPIFLMGLGLGEHLNAYVTHYKAPIQIIAWERDAWLMRLALSQHDYSRPIQSGRLKFLMGIDLIDEIPNLENRFVVHHPFFKTCYYHDVVMAEAGLNPKRALIRSGGLFVDDLAETLRAKGYSVFLWDTHLLAPAEIQRTVEKFKPTILGSINYARGLAEIAQINQIPLLCWEIDPSIDKPRKLNAPHPNTSIFTYRRENVEEYQKAGFDSVSFLPLAANSDRRKPVELSENDRKLFGAKVSFVGASMVEQASKYRHLFVELAKKFGFSDPTPKLEKILAEQREDYSRLLLPELLERHFPQLKNKIESNQEQTDPIQLLGEISAAEKRFAYLAGLGEMGVHVWGDLYWKGIEKLGCKYRGAAKHFDELTKIYCASKVNIDIGRIYQSGIITMRVFDVLSCGGCLLTEANQDIETFFDVGQELDTYKTLDELRRKTLFYLQNPDKAKAMGERGRKRILQDHTISLRIASMLESIQER